MTKLTGIGMWLWVIDSCEGGDVEAIADKAAEYGLSWVAPKATQGTALYWKNEQKLVPLAEALHDRGIRVIPWGWVHGRSTYSPYPSIAAAEAQTAFRAINLMQADGWIIDAEWEWKRTELHMDREAPKYMNQLEDLSIPIFVATYRYPKVHYTFPFKAWQNTFKPERGDGWMPQVYWEQDYREYAGALQLERSLNEHKELGLLSNSEAFYPAPPVYSRGDWSATPTQVLHFTEKVEELDLDTYVPWSWQHMTPAHWEGLKNNWYRPDAEPIPDPPDVPEEPEDPEEIKKVYVTAWALNVRLGPSAYNPIARPPLKHEMVVRVYEIQGYWGRIEKDKCHWIHLGYTRDV
jgi:hypothetical protein